jgi:hypothetical protein
MSSCTGSSFAHALVRTIILPRDPSPETTPRNLESSWFGTADIRSPSSWFNAGYSILAYWQDQHPSMKPGSFHLGEVNPLPPGLPAAALVASAADLPISYLPDKGLVDARKLLTTGSSFAASTPILTAIYRSLSCLSPRLYRHLPLLLSS